MSLQVQHLATLPKVDGPIVYLAHMPEKPHSYTYTQPVYEGRPYNLYHGTLEARPLSAKTSRIVYTLVYDNSRIPGDDAAKAAEIQRRRTAFERGVANMKILAEGGTLPPPPAPPAR